MGAALSRILEELYAVPPSAFTKARNARAAELKKRGEPGMAVTVGGLRRPTPTLWAANQLGRLDARRVEAFVDAVEAARKAQLHDPRSAGDALRRQRAALDTLVDLAGKHLAENGLRATPEALRRISNTLQGAAIDRDLAEDLRHGRLTEELAAPGFEVFAGARPGRLRVLRGGKAAAKESREDERRARREAARHERARQAEERERAARERAAELQRAKQEVEELSTKLAAARRRLGETRRAKR